MPRKKTSPEKIISLLRQIEVQMASGVTLPQACKQAQISTQSYYRWRQEFGGLQVDQAKRLKEIERENKLGSVPGWSITSMLSTLSVPTFKQGVTLLQARGARSFASLQYTEHWVVEWLKLLTDAPLGWRQKLRKQPFK